MEQKRLSWGRTNTAICYSLFVRKYFLYPFPKILSMTCCFLLCESSLFVSRCLRTMSLIIVSYSVRWYSFSSASASFTKRSVFPVLSIINKRSKLSLISSVFFAINMSNDLGLVASSEKWSNILNIMALAESFNISSMSSFV